MSEIGAAHKSVFVGFAVVSGLLLPASLGAARFLRLQDRLPGLMRSREHVFEIAAIGFSGAASIMLVCAASIDLFKSADLHLRLLAAFVLLTIMTIASQACEIYAVSHSHPDFGQIRAMSRIKMLILSVTLISAAIFVATFTVCQGQAHLDGFPKCDGLSNAAAFFEWFTALLIGGYYGSLVVDFWPSARNSAKALHRVEAEEAWQMAQRPQPVKSILKRPTATFADESAPDPERDQSGSVSPANSLDLASAALPSSRTSIAPSVSRATSAPAPARSTRSSSVLKG